ncbi:MAG: alpha-hydroxy acid oxidase, partial [Candidatus Latescibacterota bacterium]|nr:alpha-hydroxy acid oxidase [Candidatus Latescibacterota bacterium]
GGLLPFCNIINEHGEPMPYAGIGQQLAASAVTWSDLPWIKEAWGDLPLIVKGVHCAEDALRAEELGATGVIFSNHGGRQLGRAIPSLQIVAEAMPTLRAANSKLDCAMDGGIRSGLDVLIGLSYGLKAVGLGRVTAGGLGAGGHLGLTRAFELIKEDLLRSMELLGVQNISEIQQQGERFRRQNMVLGTEHIPQFSF